LRPQYYHKSSTDELDTVKEVYDDLVYKPEWFKITPDNIRVVVDIGALIGSFTLWAIEQWPKAIIHCFEPDPESFEYLTKNIKEAGAQKQVNTYNQAVWKTDKQLTLHRFKNTPGSNSIVFLKRPFVGNYENSIQVKSTSLSNFLKKIPKPVDFLKVDCEGSEYDIFYSLSESELKKIRHVVIEYHEFDNEKNHTGVALSDYLRKRGFMSQIIPTNIRQGSGLGYIYASSVTVDRNLIKIFDKETSRLVSQQKIANEREDYAKDLEQTVTKVQKLADEREDYAKDMEQTVIKVQKLAEERVTKVQKLAEERVTKVQKLADERVTKVQKLADERAKNLEQTITKVQKLANEREDYSQDLERTLMNKDVDILNLNQAIQNKTSDLIYLRDELAAIHSSLIFKFMRSISKKIDSTFPNRTKRGQLKKIVTESLETVEKEGYKNYLASVKTRLGKQEFKINSSSRLSESDEHALIKQVHKNRKKRLQIKPHGKNEIKNDEFVIEDDLM